MINILISMILLLPWVFIPNDKLADPFRLPKYVAYDVFCLVIIAYAFFSGIRTFYRNKALSYLSAWVFFTIFMTWYLPSMLSFNNQRAIAIPTIEPSLHFILTIFISFILLSYLTKDHFIKIAKAICLSSVLVCLFGILQLIGLDPFGKLARYEVGGDLWHFSAILDNPTVMGNYLALSLPFFLIFKSLKYYIGFIIVAIGIVLSLSKLALIASVFGLMIYLLLLHRRSIILWLSSIILLVSGIIFIPHLNWHNRFQCWNMTITNIKDNVLFGHGLGYFKLLNFKTDNTIWMEAHNDWLQYWLELGLIGIILMLYVIFHSLKNFNYNKENSLGFSYMSSFIIFLILMLASFPMEVAPTAILGLVGYFGIEKL